jgi:hypothetical protein
LGIKRLVFEKLQNFEHLERGHSWGTCDPITIKELPDNAETILIVKKNEIKSWTRTVLIVSLGSSIPLDREIAYLISSS